MAKATVYERYGGPEVLSLGDVELPKPGGGQVRVLVKAVGVNPMDVKVRRGDVKELFDVSFPATPGSEVAGVVDEVGPDVPDFNAGDEILSMTDGGAYAVRAGRPGIRQATAVELARGCGASTVAGAAYRSLGPLQVRASETLLVHGAAGSAGSVIAQLAVGRGVTVVGTARPDDVAFVTGLGAAGVAYGEGRVQRVEEAAPQGIDAVLDTSGAGMLPESIKLVGGTERVITIADDEAPKARREVQHRRPQRPLAGRVARAHRLRGRRTAQRQGGAPTRWKTPPTLSAPSRITPPGERSS